jgi:hypothetical protein
MASPALLHALDVAGVRCALLAFLSLADAQRLQGACWCSWHGVCPSAPLALSWLRAGGPSRAEERAAAWSWLAGADGAWLREEAADALGAAAAECERQSHAARLAAGGAGSDAHRAALASVMGPGGEIERDVLRTFPELPLFRPPAGSGLIAANGAPHPPALAALPLGHGIQQLRHVLIAYALARPHVMYCQGAHAGGGGGVGEGARRIPTYPRAPLLPSRRHELRCGGGLVSAVATGRG